MKNSDSVGSAESSFGNHVKSKEKPVGHWNTEDDKTAFQVRAPKRKTVELALNANLGVADANDGAVFHSMDRDDEGFFSIALPALPSGTEYRYRLDGEHSRPNPAARYFTSSVHDWAQVVDH